MQRNRIVSGVKLVILGLFIYATNLTAAPRLPGFFTDNMVLQRDITVKIWGWADPQESITVEFAGQKLTTTADKDGNWLVKLAPMKANSENRILAVGDTIKLSNVVVGDVWVCSGQSNMEWALRQVINTTEECAAANYPLIRQIKFSHLTSDSPQNDIKSAWQICAPDTAGSFTAVGYFFGRKLHQNLNVPIGLINTSWGGTRVEPWTAPEGFRMIPELKDIADKLGVDTAASNGKKSHQEPTRIYNSMIAPILNYAIRGAIWYQGESNGSEGISYFHKKQALINGWRKLWAQGDFPFYFVQLANYHGDNNNPAGGDGYAIIRDAQKKCLEIKNTGMAVIIDIGESGDIHPKNKQDVGLRLALWALAKEYGQKDLVYSGPLFKEQSIDGNKIRIKFDNVGSGLMVGEKVGLEPTKEIKDGTLKRFAIAGEDKKWVWADATIDNDTVIVSSPEVQNPVAVRYAFSACPTGCNLYNKEGLPASPFRTDNW